MDKPLVSIVIPSWNRESFLAKTIDSYLGQSYKNIELILVDDGSTDDSRILYDYYTEKDKRVKVIYIKHSGISVARNTGINESSGEYIMVGDSDDLAVKDRVKESLKAIKDNDFVYSPYAVEQNGQISVVDCPKKVTFEDVKKNGSYPHVTIMGKRECFEGAYRDDFLANDDAWLCWQFFRKYKGKKISKPMVLVRFHEGNTTKQKRKEIDRTQKIMDKEYENYQK